jgi:hypothetical protein
MSGSSYEPPPGGEEGSDLGYGSVEYANPDTSALGEASFEAGPEALGGISDELLAARDAVENALRAQDRSARLQTVEAFSGPESNIQGVAIGLSEPGQGEPGKPALHIYVAEETTPDAVRSAMASAMGVQAVDDSVQLVVKKIGIPEIQPHRFRIRPAPGGVSVGHFRVTAGTIGCLSIGRSAPRNARLMVLSNNHVLANSNNASGGECIVQPGTADGGRCPADQIGILESFVPIRFGGATNYLDCATAWCWPDRVRREEMFLSGGVPQFFRIGSTPAWPALGMLVGKTGRTTQLTQGRVVALNWSGWIDYREAGRAFFAGQVIIQSTSTEQPFSLGGDSGSIIWEWASGLRPVALLFAGGGGFTIANPLPWVVNGLDINLVT